MSPKVAELYRQLRPIVLDALAGLEPEKRKLFGDADTRLAPSPKAGVSNIQTQPVVEDWLAHCASTAPAETAGVAQAALAATKELDWVRSYEELPASPVVDAFRDNFSYCALGGEPFRGSPCPIQLENLMLGLTLMAPGVWYPPHHHEATELYGVLSGPLQWQLDKGEWFDMAPGQVVAHESNQLHAMKTDDSPTLTWVLWPGNLACDVLMDDLD